MESGSEVTPSSGCDVVYCGGDFGKLESGASGCLMSYKNSGMIGTANNKKIGKFLLNKEKH